MTRDREFNQVAATRYGTFVYNRNDRYVGRCIELYGEFSELEIELLRQLCGPGSTVVDVGANIGVHTVALAKHVGETGFVLAFEPQRVVFQTLCANVALNSLLNVDCVHAAVGAERGTVYLPDVDHGKPANYGGISPERFAGGHPVRQVTLNEYADAPGVALLRIGVEGLECDVLTGAGTFVARHRPLMYVENECVERSEQLIAAIAALDYRMFWHLPPLYNPRNVRGQAENAFAGIVSANVLCVPRERRVTIEGFDEILDPAQHPFR